MFDSVNVVGSSSSKLSVKSKPEWQNVKFSRTYSASFSIVGSNILHTVPKGQPEEDSITKFLHFRAKILKESGLWEVPHFEVKDYQHTQTRTDKKSRIVYTEHLKEEFDRGYLQCLCTYNTPLVLKLFFNVGKKIYGKSKELRVFDTYEQAIESILASQNHELVQDALAPNMSFKDDWSYQNDKYGAIFKLIDDDILYDFSYGSIAEADVKNFYSVQKKVIKESGLQDKGYYYRVSDWSKMEKINWRARALYSQLGTELHQELVCRLFVIFGLNSFFKTVINVWSKFSPVPIIVVDDFLTALRTVYDHRKKHSTGSVKKQKSVSAEPVSNNKAVDSLVDYISTINWDKKGIEKIEHAQSDPLAVIYDALFIIKHDYDMVVEEKNRIQRDLLQSSKLATIGELASGITHEINNPLSVVCANIDILKRTILSGGAIDSDKCVSSFEKIDKSIVRIQNIIDELKKFVRADTSNEFTVFDVKDCISECLELLKSIIGKHIRITTNFSKDNLCIKGSSIKLQQVITNLLTNARDALDKVSDSYIRINAFLDKNDVVIEVKDNGCGIPEEIIDKVFDSFFTTKPAGKGTGLGLSISLSLVRLMKGSMDVVSSKIAGTTFIIRFPVVVKNESNN